MKNGIFQKDPDRDFLRVNLLFFNITRFEK